MKRLFAEDVRLFAELCNAGVNLVRSCTILRDSGLAPGTRTTMEWALPKFEQGATLSSALSEAPDRDWASPLTVAFVRAGEIGGILDETLANLANYLDKETELRANWLPGYETALAFTLWGKLLVSGMPILQTLSVTAGTVDDPKVKTTLLAVRDRIKEGDSLGECTELSEVAEPFALPMIAIGEECGRLDEMLERVAMLQIRCSKTKAASAEA